MSQKTDIITAINTDHLAVVLGVDSLAEYPRDGEETTDANVILKEIYDFYSDLYDKKLEIQSDFTGCPFVENSSTVPKLNYAMGEMYEGQ
ncbi:unnamed protein product, partial [Porites evermanni]